MPSMIRIDKGTETGTMGTIHAFLHQAHTDIKDPTDTVIYGPSTANQVYYVYAYFFRRNCFKENRW